MDVDVVGPARATAERVRWIEAASKNSPPGRELRCLALGVKAWHFVKPAWPELARAQHSMKDAKAGPGDAR